MTRYYRVLGIPKEASEKEIAAAYKKLALTHHPKRYKPRPMLTPSEHAQEQLIREQTEELESLQIFMVSAEAYDVLSDPMRKAIYDQFGEKILKEGLPGPDGFISGYAYHGDPFRTFKEFFGTENPFSDLLTAACTPSDAYVNKDVKGLRVKEPTVYKQLPLTLEEVYNGTIKKLIVSKKVLKEDGENTELLDKVLTVKIPPGTPHGMQFSFPNEGDQGPKISPADVVFLADIAEHPRFVREGNNLSMEVPITLHEALCGVLIPVKTLDNRVFKVYNVHVVQPGFEKVVPNEGMPIYDSPGQRGDLIIRYKVKYPNKLTESQKKLLSNALDPQQQSGFSPYEKKPPITFTITDRCACPEIPVGMVKDLKYDILNPMAPSKEDIGN